MTTPRKKKPKPRRRGQITKLKSGAYFARFRYPPDPVTGKRGGPSKSCGTMEEAEAFLADEIARFDRGERMGASPTQSLGAFLVEFYTNIRKATKGDGVLSPATCQADLELLSLYIIKRAPGLANTPLAKLTTPPIRDHFKALSSSGLAAATVSRVHRTLRARLAYAQAEWLIRLNPMSDARIPVSGKKKRKRAILSAEHAAALFAVCPESCVGPYIATLLWTGGRPSEISGLTWPGIDLDRREIDIHQAIVRLKPSDEEKGHGVSWTIANTKTSTDRKVPIPDVLVAMLRRHKAEQAAERLAAGSEYEQNDLVFCSAFGRPYHLDTITSRYLKPLLRRAALHMAGETPLPLPPHSRSKAYLAALAARTAQEDAAIAATAFPMGVGLYSLRHSLATRLDQLKVPIKDIQEILGHADIATTLGYIQGSEQRRRDALGALEDAILPKTGKLGIA